jgi:membrane-associated phospholipid phosphatase
MTARTRTTRVLARVSAVLLPLVLLAGLWWLTTMTGWGRGHDFAAAEGRHVAGTGLLAVDWAVLDAVTVVSVGIGLLLVLVVGHRRHRTGLAVRAVLAVGGAAATSEILKLTLPLPMGHGRFVSGGGSFPSGHTTVVAALTLALLSTCAPRWRSVLAAPLVALTVLASTATISVGWHRPSDVVGGLLVVAAWHRALVGRQRHRSLGVVAALGWAVTTALVLVSAVPADERSALLHADLLSADLPHGYLAALAVSALACLLVLAVPGLGGRRRFGGRAPAAQEG